MRLLRTLVAAGAALLLLPRAPIPLAAESTKEWTQTLLEDFEKGTAERITMRSDGKLLLAPRFREIYAAPSSYLWALVTDSKGNVLVGAGPDAKVYRIGADGKASTLFKADAIEIHALAVDKDDNVYAATSPDAKIYKIDPSGDAKVFFDPPADYVWDMEFDSKGQLFVATGDQGVIYRVSPSGEGSVFFETGETHVRSVVIDAQDNLIVGTDPSGLILRVSAAANAEPAGFVLYQSAKKEITALTQGKDGTIYAAGVGDRKATPAAQPRSTVSVVPPASTAVNPSLMPGAPQGVAQTPYPVVVAAPSVLLTQVTGGSEIYRIAPDGEPRRLWESKSDIVYALGLDPQGKLLAGTGDRGRLIRLESETLYSVVLTATSSQITALAAGLNDKILTATSNIGRIYELGPELESEGTFQSQTFDAKIFSRWGRLEWVGETPGTARIAVSTRSGNLESPSRNWSEWSKPLTSPEGGPSGSPAARFVQWQAVMSSPEQNASPVLDAVTLYYRPNNIGPQLTAIEATPPNYSFERPARPTAAQKLTLPALGSSTPRRKVSAAAVTAGQAMSPAPGQIGARWAASDENDDDLVYKLEIRGEDEQTWKLVEEKIEEPYWSWDSTSFADGHYRVRVTVSDAPSNPASEAKTDSRVSEPFLIDNTAPAIRGLSATAEGQRLRVRFEAADTASNLQKAEYSLDGAEWQPILPLQRQFDSKQLSFEFPSEPVKQGEHTVAVRVYDEHDNVATGKVVVR